jgi:hypothetical protein
MSRVLARSLLVVVSGAAALLMTELLLSWVSPMYFSNTVEQFRYDGELGSIAKPDLRLSKLTDHLIEVATNDGGTRNYANSETLRGYSGVVFSIGDSYTEGVGNLTDESYPFYLDLLLNETGGGYQRRFAVYNLGLGAYGSIQSARIVNRYITALGRAPDVIVYLICDNDPDDDAAFRNGLKHDNVVDGSPRFPGWYIRLNQIFERSQVYLRAKLVGRAVRNRMRGLDEAVAAAPAAGDLEARLPGLRELKQIAGAHKTRVILSYTEFNTPAYDEVRQYAEKNGWGFADYKPAVLEVRSAMPDLPTHHTHSGGHFRSWVNLIIARRTAELIERLYPNHG